MSKRERRAGRPLADGHASQIRGAVGSIAVVKPDGSDAKLLHPGHRPVWSPDSSRLAFRNNGLYVMRRDGTRVRSWRASWAGITFSPNSKQIAYIDGAGHDPLGILYIKAIDGSRRVALQNRHQRFLTPLWRGETWTTERG
jgi:Tol biopolymer transport system component